MKRSKIFAIVSGIALVSLVGVMGVLNPSQMRYEEYAAQRLTRVLKEDGCKQLKFGLQDQCPTWVDENQAEIKQFISQNTSQQNFMIFSVYTTDLSVRSLLPSLPFFASLPSYHFETIGAFQSFYTYKAKIE